MNNNSVSGFYVGNKIISFIHYILNVASSKKRKYYAVKFFLRFNMIANCVHIG